MGLGLRLGLGPGLGLYGVRVGVRVGVRIGVRIRAGGSELHLRLEGLLVELTLTRLRLLHHLMHEARPAAAQLAVGVVSEGQQPPRRGEHERVEVARVHLGRARTKVREGEG